jgi:hypothetical protein
MAAGSRTRGSVRKNTDVAPTVGIQRFSAIWWKEAQAIAVHSGIWNDIVVVANIISYRIENTLSVICSATSNLTHIFSQGFRCPLLSDSLKGVFH